MIDGPALTVLIVTRTSEPADPEALALPVALHHRDVGGQGRHEAKRTLGAGRA
jgi:hypothetical protein